MLNEMGVKRGWTCIDVGCGSMGIIGSLARRVGPFGKVYALDCDPTLLAAAREYVDREGFGNVVFLHGDLFKNNRPPKSFDLVHVRFMLAPIGREPEILEHLTSLVRRSGIVALEEPNANTWHCEPSSADWDQMKGAILNAFEQGGGDFNVGARLGRLLRQSGVEPVSVRETTLTLPGRHPYSALIVRMAESLRSKIISGRLLTEAEFERLFARAKKCSAVHIL
jgi:precorrin-6B methylase 2